MVYNVIRETIILHYISRKCLVRDTTEETESMLLRFSYT